MPDPLGVKVRFSLVPLVISVPAPCRLSVVPVKLVVPAVPIVPKPVSVLALLVAEISPIPEIAWLPPVIVPPRV